MAIRDIRSQRNSGYAIDLDLSGSAAEKMVMQAQICQRLYWDGLVWRIFDHTSETAPNHTQVQNGFYNPRFRVRAMKIEGDNHIVQHDLANDGMRWTRDSYAAEVLHPLHVTGLFLDPAHIQTTCDAVTLYG